MMTLRRNLIGIEPGVIKQKVNSGAFVELSAKKGEQPCTQTPACTNVYYRVNNADNMVYLHLRDGYGVFINEYVATNQGRIINLVDALSGYYWNIWDSNNNVPKCSQLKNRSIYRCIGSIILYGDIHTRMPSWYQVHHKWWRWCNMWEFMTFTCHKRHQYYHNYVGTRKSHQRGAVVHTSKELDKWLYTINHIRDDYRRRKM